jgi:hypothetical protein
LYACENLFFTYRKEYRLRLRMLRRILVPNREEVREDGENIIMKSFITCTVHEMLLR